MAVITTMHPAYLGRLAWVNYVSLEPNRYWRKIIIKISLMESYKGV
jgi:hypothetical protein